MRRTETKRSAQPTRPRGEDAVDASSEATFEATCEATFAATLETTLDAIRATAPLRVPAGLAREHAASGGTAGVDRLRRRARHHGEPGRARRRSGAARTHPHRRHALPRRPHGLRAARARRLHVARPGGIRR